MEHGAQIQRLLARVVLTEQQDLVGRHVREVVPALVRPVDQALIHDLGVLLDVAGVLAVAEHDVVDLDGTHVANGERHHPNRFRNGAAPDVDALEVPCVRDDASEALLHRRRHVGVNALGVRAAAAVGGRLDAPGTGLAAEPVAVFVAAAAHLVAPGDCLQEIAALRVETGLNDIVVQKIELRRRDGKLEAVAVQRGGRIQQPGVVHDDVLPAAQGLEIVGVFRRIVVGNTESPVQSVGEVGRGLDRRWLRIGHFVVSAVRFPAL